MYVCVRRHYGKHNGSYLTTFVDGPEKQIMLRAVELNTTIDTFC